VGNDATRLRVVSDVGLAATLDQYCYFRCRLMMMMMMMNECTLTWRKS